MTAQLWADSKPLTLPVQTAYKPFRNARIWNEWLTLPISYSTIPLNAQLAVTVWDLSPTGCHSHAIPFGGTTIQLFDKDNVLQKGRQRCRLHRHKEADGLSSTTTPYIRKPPRGGQKLANGDAHNEDGNQAELERLVALMKKHEMGEIAESKWLDQLVFRQIEKLERASYKNGVTNKRHAVSNGVANGTHTNGDDAHGEDGEEADEDLFYLYIEFPRFDHPVVFTDQEYPAPPISTLRSSSNSASGSQLKPPPEVSPGPGINLDVDSYGEADAGRLIRIYDPEVGIRDNPAENKHRRLNRSHRAGLLDRDLKPNAKIRDELNVC